MSDYTATQRASAMYNKVKNISSGKLELEISWGTVGIVMLLAMAYVAIASTGHQHI
jgi:TRAP-type mannitol/chloroaromatic compound transport system permease small subunit